MKIEVLESNAKVFRFLLKGSSSTEANALRRAAINSVPCFAINSITFYENTSAVFDEYIAHRIGLIPINTPAKGYTEKDEILFTLDATGPKTVYSKELKGADEDVQVANPDIPIIKLGEEQRVRIDGKAIMATGQKHSKFQAGLVTYDKKGDDYEFYVEAFGQMPPKEIINKALEVIKEEALEIQKELKKL